MDTTKVKWLMDGKRQIDRFGKWVRVTEGEVSDHPTDQLRRVVEGLHYELVKEPSEKSPVPDELIEEPSEGTTAPADDEAPQSGSDGADPAPPVVDTPLAEKPKPKRKGRRKITKKE